MDPRFAPAVETEQSQGLTNEEFDGLRSTLRKSIFYFEISKFKLLILFKQIMMMQSKHYML